MRRRQSKFELDEFLRFDELPDSALVSQPVVEAVLDVSGPTVWRRIRDGRLPRPRKIGPRGNRWSVGELRSAAKGGAR